MTNTENAIILAAAKRFVAASNRFDRSPSSRNESSAVRAAVSFRNLCGIYGANEDAFLWMAMDGSLAVH